MIKKKSLSFLFLEGDCSKKDARNGPVRAGAEENPVSAKCKQSASHLCILGPTLTLQRYEAKQ